MNQITIEDIWRLDQMGPDEETRFWEVFTDELARDDGAAAAHLAAGRPITYCADEYPAGMIRKWPDGRRELVDLDVNHNVFVIRELPRED